MERQTLWVSACGCLVIGCVGATVAVLSGSQAVLLDGLFNLAYFATGLFTLQVARLVQRGDDATFPYGYVFFEPLVNGIKGLMVLGVSILAAVDAGMALFSGGRQVAAGLAVAYGLFATVAGSLLAAILSRGARRTGSPLVEADVRNWIVNTAVSACVLATFAAIFLIRDTPLDFLVPYVDPGLVLLVVSISVAVPIRMAWQALMEILNRTPSPQLLEQMTQIVREGTADLPVQGLFVRVIQPGRTRMVAAHIVLPSDFQVEGLAAFDAIREKTDDRLRQAHPSTVLDLIFTADPRWGLPSGGMTAENKSQHAKGDE